MSHMTDLVPNKLSLCDRLYLHRIPHPSCILYLSTSIVLVSYSLLLIVTSFSLLKYPIRTEALLRVSQAGPHCVRSSNITSSVANWPHALSRDLSRLTLPPVFIPLPELSGIPIRVAQQDLKSELRLISGQFIPWWTTHDLITIASSVSHLALYRRVCGACVLLSVPLALTVILGPSSGRILGFIAGAGGSWKPPPIESEKDSKAKGETPLITPRKSPWLPKPGHNLWEPGASAPELMMITLMRLPLQRPTSI
ncbi:hypothetical protein F4803DRAFT_45843 [Xylaria telfairii]|nr:hypothetical protein F4803DRAFT_45843 [Xylaria telfairii]